MKPENKLIAEFLGWEVSYHGRTFDNGDLPPHGYVKVDPDCLKFDRSWDWLMIAIEKVGKLMPKFKMPEDLAKLKAHTHPAEKHMNVIALPVYTPREEVFEELIKFITWYNEQKSKQ